MGELDVGLISEFANNTILYDKSNPYFKNKLMSLQAWDGISQKLGYKGKTTLPFFFIF
jgi:Alcohol dehydrogenase transcription factor Myb/SANT-like